ncbi:MAG: sigma-54-dependent Fis family transcriptional regulator [Betaproteobacteria bacterium]|jgi:two-component system response regulator PilR (NtrC family)|nr:MAG: sigma-54-dependent Fis family transcriptional regulator [Betaproteobacteria bacterium]TMH22599.1 MAG: sigma-54-dependent Fis family transcriptional regulator [Betaproteobacteria bacterium]TMH53418.1 MAG: sigma-54-dependent Fis family transcriptional regulator [Betaproteobacteria bacterium]TMI06241.1 MAG: sigma-54-dependent Fis family transcriptional regulator [Betaproteobacteria bacterium]
MSRRPRERGQPKVLVIDDEPDLLELLELTLSRMGLDTTRAQSVAEAIRLLDAQAFDLCLTDMRLPDGEGLRVVEHITEKGLDVPVAVITAFGSAENAVAALKAGAFDYLAKPVALEQLRALVKQALKVPEKPAAPSSYQLLGESQAIMQVRQMIDRLSKSQAPVFITGESGSGKELAARMIHLGGPRAEQPFVPVNCGAIPENLMESEFFGYKKGAFTGAEGDRDGFFQAANGGTLFLDEVADLPLPMQVKLLRSIQEKRVRKVGSTTEEPVDVRIISATHKKLTALVEAGEFRQDLFYRLHVIELAMPSLREMREDIPSIADALLHKMSRAAPAKLDAEAAAALESYPFPGNVRELENILERGLSLAADPQKITADDLHLTPPPEEIDAALPTGDKWPLQDYLDRVERAAINEALEKTRYNRTAAAKLLGITFRAMRYRMERLGIK